jgi:hypothetical protein
LDNAHTGILRARRAPHNTKKRVGKSKTGETAVSGSRSIASYVCAFVETGTPSKSRLVLRFQQATSLLVGRAAAVQRRTSERDHSSP